jgi:hypothetical protein
MSSRVIYNSFAAVLYQIFKQLESLINLSPLASLLLHESTVDAGHDLIELLTMVYHLLGYFVTKESPKKLTS